VISRPHRRPRVVVLAKSPVPGRVKTRLCPPLTPRQAADLAEAALSDTLAAILAATDVPPALVLDGEPGAWLPSGFDVIAQRPGPLGARLAGAFADAGSPAFLVGMDTPQVTPTLITQGLLALEDPRYDAVIGPAADGGYWAIGLRVANDDVFRSVPMSTPNTLRHQRARLAKFGLRVAELATLRDVDEIADAEEVARLAPSSRFAAVMERHRTVGGWAVSQ
jgi:rSAM/selenodomain-associated transferase 1